MKLVFYLAALGLAAALSGCAGPQPVLPAPYTIVISADAKLNLDSQNQAMPVQVRLYELKNSSNFQSIDFYTLFDKDDQALGGDVLSKEQLMLLPGQKVTLARKANPEARLLGVFVAFRDVERSGWRAVAPLPQAKAFGRFRLFSPSYHKTQVSIHLGSLSVAAATIGGDAQTATSGTGGSPWMRTPSMPSVSVPSVSAPSVSVPSVSAPSVSMPSVSVPSVSAPSVSVPSVPSPSFHPGGW
jgi:type VI secretion system protein VasD